jgi:hypothetical protein
MMDVAITGRAATAAIILSVTVLEAPSLSVAAATTNAVTGKHTAKSSRQTRAAILNSATPERTCSWVGPDGRAIYVSR